MVVMSAPAAPACDPRLAFFEIESKPEANEPKRGDLGPSIFHTTHGTVQLSPGREIRVTTQRAKRLAAGQVVPGRIVIRTWVFCDDGWWPLSRDGGVCVAASDAAAFSKAVAAAALAVERDKP